MLAASVVAGAGLGPFPRLQLVLLLFITALVFWATDVYTFVVGDRMAHRSLTWEEIRRAGIREWPIVVAAVPPAAAVTISPVFGLGVEGTVWFALAAAVAELIGWTSAALIRAGASRRLVVISGAVNLVFGLVFVAAKTALHH
ncbi:hypothetical protein LIU39_01630 [Streptomyces sp. SF28]|nr:hypothetical protein [Streptomyces pinistramenti]